MAPASKSQPSPARRRLAAVALLGAAVAASAALLVGPLADRAPARSRPQEVRLVQLNICGHACRGNRPVAGAVEALAMARPEAAGLDEVCRSQLGEVVSGLHRRGWAMAATFLVTLAGACGGDDYGIAVLTRSPVVDADTLTYRTQSPGSVERRGLVCALTSVGGRRTRVCSTHLVSHGEERSDDVGRGQVAEAAALTRSYRLPVVLMGDLNMSPDDVGTAALYSPAHGSSAGVFDEVDEGPDRCRCGAATHSGGAKLDYVFVTAHDFAVNGARALDVPSSDHDLLRGVVSLR